MTPKFGDAACRLAAVAATMLGWRPDEFWESTPAELATALGMDATDAPGPDRATFTRLMQQFPDEKRQRWTTKSSG